MSLPFQPLFDVERFTNFCTKLKIDSKEKGRTPLYLLGAQRYFIEKIAEGLANGIHTFVVLKGRQLGISTVCLALDLYWMAKHAGLQGAIVTDTDETREVFRSQLEDYHKSLPSQVRSPIKRHNRVQVQMQNSSRLVYLVAGEKKKGNLGRGKAVNFMHATECSSWGDEEGFASLMNTLAQQNPKRLYIFESTARGFNMFYQTWETAKESKTQMAIFIGWWRNELYSWPETSVEYQTFWDGDLTSDERVWVKEVFEQYGHSITAEQIAWWRWYVQEHMKGDELMALQEMPPTEDYAFQLSGSKFFSGERVNILHQRAIKQECLYFRYKFGMNFEDTEFIETTAENAEVTIWETPDEKGVYALGADPAYGSSEWADEFAAQMGRCYADRWVQVLELGSPDWTEAQFAWALAHLAGWYGRSPTAECMLNLELLGPGGAVYNELLNLRIKAGFIPASDTDRSGAFNVIGRIRDYLYKKQDSLSGNFAQMWNTNSREKLRMMSTLRSYFERDSLEINSPVCLQQFRNIHRNGDSIGGEGRAKDDRVIALGISVIAWNDWLMIQLAAQGRTYAREMRPAEEQKAIHPVENSVVNYLKKNGIHLRGLT